MITLYDNNDRNLGTITEAQLQFLIDSMEEESLEDQDYYMDPATLDYLESRGADATLMAVLRAALGGREEATIRWSK
ncbi:MAG TPA: hypothetical protein VF434_02245 [Promineifilum sp.]